MKYYNLKSIFAANKKALPMRSQSNSFYIAPNRDDPYIEPNFAKIIFETEKPKVILISAVGATGKTALAQVLSSTTGLPLLDLGKHKPVGDNTLTGLLTSSFSPTYLSQIFLGFTDGSFGVIIDGVDEGRSKTTEKAFEAFLDNIHQLCNESTGTTFILLGRTKIIEETWLYFSDRGISTGLIAISPFDMASARKYIDKYTRIGDSGFQVQYNQARDYILNLLAKAFLENTNELNKDFLSFIGYPPVLDAIVTLLKDETNYHKLLTQLQNPDTNDVEVTLLHRISNYILRREKIDKVQINILEPLVEGMPSDIQTEIIRETFEPEEQCIRLIALCLNQKLHLHKISERVLNEKYEEQLAPWILEHPFINGNQFRNVVFEAVALATLMASPEPLCKDLVIDYFNIHKFSYHLIYLLNIIARDKLIPIEYLNILLGSALEFRSNNSSVEIYVDGPEANDKLPDDVEIEIEILLGRAKDTSKMFTFRSSLPENVTINLSGRLATSYISLPCAINISNNQEIEITSPVEIHAEKLALNSRVLTLKHDAQASDKQMVAFQVDSLESSLLNIETNSIPLKLIVSETRGLAYPIIQYTEKSLHLPADNLIQEKYIRLRKILMQFRSHSKGALAKYRPKIENERVVRNDMGRAILSQLLKDEILTVSGSFYYLQPEGIDRYLGISWFDLRMGKSSDKLIQYLRAIN